LLTVLPEFETFGLAAAASVWQPPVLRPRPASQRRPLERGASTRRFAPTWPIVLQSKPPRLPGFDAGAGRDGAACDCAEQRATRGGRMRLPGRTLRRAVRATPPPATAATVWTGRSGAGKFEHQDQRQAMETVNFTSRLRRSSRERDIGAGFRAHAMTMPRRHDCVDSGSFNAACVCSRRWCRC